jgi:hypothetical protein
LKKSPQAALTRFHDFLGHDLQHEHEVAVGDVLDARGGREADEAKVALVLVEGALSGARETLPGEVLDDIRPERSLLVGLVPHRAQHLPPLAEGEAGRQ